MKRHRLVTILIFCWFAGGSVFANPAPQGRVVEHNQQKSQITILPDTPGSIRTGQTIIVYSKNRKQKIGPAKVVRVYHTKVIAEPQGPTWAMLKSDRNDLVASTEMPLIFEQPVIKTTIVSYKDVLAPGRRWKVNVNYTSQNCAPTERLQTRALPLSNWIGFRKSGDSFYDTLPAREIKSIFLNRKDNQTTANQLITTKGQQIFIKEIMSRALFERLSPPDSCANDDQLIRIDLISVGQQLKEDPDTIQFKVVPSQLSKLLKTKRADSTTLLFQIRSNTEFISEFTLTDDDLKSKELLLPVPSCYFSPGDNRLEFSLVESQLVEGDLFEAGERKIISSQLIFINDHQLPKVVSIELK
ncbi:MAG: hypothetical protein H3C43_01265 [Leptonema sp. (in: Bacteria)]|nr:hypothetical protein [Leptonema sp. (in: bacteria)]